MAQSRANVNYKNSSTWHETSLLQWIPVADWLTFSNAHVCTCTCVYIHRVYTKYLDKIQSSPHRKKFLAIPVWKWLVFEVQLYNMLTHSPDAMKTKASTKHNCPCTNQSVHLSAHSYTMLPISKSVMNGVCSDLWCRYPSKLHGLTTMLLWIPMRV